MPTRDIDSRDYFHVALTPSGELILRRGGPVPARYAWGGGIERGPHTDADHAPETIDLGSLDDIVRKAGVLPEVPTLLEGHLYADDTSDGVRYLVLADAAPVFLLDSSAFRSESYADLRAGHPVPDGWCDLGLLTDLIGTPKAEAKAEVAPEGTLFRDRDGDLWVADGVGGLVLMDVEWESNDRPAEDISDNYGPMVRLGLPKDIPAAHAG